MYYAAALAAFALPLGGVGDYRPGPLTGAHATGATVTAAAATRTYGGHTSAGEPIVLRRSGRKVKTIVLQVHTPCDSGAFFPAATTIGGGGKSTAPAITGGRLSRKGDFTATASGTADLGSETATVLLGVEGRLTAKHSSGAVIVDVTVKDNATGQQTDHCQTSESWSQTVPERRTFGGSTSEDTPVVIELNRTRTSVRTFWFGLFADCMPDGAINPSDAITNFRIRRHRFGDSFSDEGDDGSGGRLHVDYALKGKIGRSTASGTIEITAIDRDAQGNVTSNCPSGPVPWVAQQ
jgi:hypothetical protein